MSYSTPESLTLDDLQLKESLNQNSRRHYEKSVTFSDQKNNDDQSWEVKQLQRHNAKLLIENDILREHVSLKKENFHLHGIHILADVMHLLDEHHIKCDYHRGKDLSPSALPVPDRDRIDSYVRKESHRALRSPYRHDMDTQRNPNHAVDSNSYRNQQHRQERYSANRRRHGDYLSFQRNSLSENTEVRSDKKNTPLDSEHLSSRDFRQKPSDQDLYQEEENMPSTNGYQEDFGRKHNLFIQPNPGKQEKLGGSGGISTQTRSQPASKITQSDKKAKGEISEMLSILNDSNKPDGEPRNMDSKHTRFINYRKQLHTRASKGSAIAKISLLESNGTRLLGEIAFQLDKRILSVVLNGKFSKTCKYRSFYGYTVANLHQRIIERERGEVKEIMLKRYSTLMKTLEFLGYSTPVHSNKAVTLVNKYGVMKHTYEDMKKIVIDVTDEGLIRDIVRSISSREEVHDVLLLLQCLAVLSADDGMPMFVW